MIEIIKILFQSIAVVFMTAMLFSCKNDTNKVRDFLAEKNLPIGIAKDAYHVYKDSGFVSSKLITPLLYDYSNRELHPYNEFPKGITIVKFDKATRDSVTIKGDYALTYQKTSISEIKGNVIVINHKENTVLKTDQMYWDQVNKYFFSEEKFTLTSPTSNVRGVGFESKEDLSEWVSKNITGKKIITEKDDL